MSIVIQTIEHSSPYLSDIKRLGKRNSATLGFFPEGAFDDHAQRQQIIAAICENGKLAGYLLYRVSNRTARIVHLCVDERFLGKGV
ncbi:MAG TPA: GNAT family N-acetyltransferase, partial [Pyrinomonadaceae bacterium]|nr:GNAT family N-acetyltransferase [Pyrinomonadaceae bacterium]